MGSFFYKEDACGCFSWISKCLGIKTGDINILPKTQNKEESTKEEINKLPEEPAKEETIKLPIRNLEMLKCRASFSLLEGLSLKELNKLLRKNPHTFDDNKKKLWIDEESLKSCLMISAKALNIDWVNDQSYWKWIPHNKSSFGEVAKLEKVGRFHVRANIECGLLSPATKYKVSFRVKFEGLSGWERSPAKISLSTSWGFKYESARYFSDLNKPVGIKWVADATFRKEEDGWVELDAGCFELPEGVDEDESSNWEVEVTIKQVEAVWKSGVFIDCVKVVPLKLQHEEEGSASGEKK